MKSYIVIKINVIYKINLLLLTRCCLVPLAACLRFISFPALLGLDSSLLKQLPFSHLILSRCLCLQLFGETGSLFKRMRPDNHPAEISVSFSSLLLSFLSAGALSMWRADHVCHVRTPLCLIDQTPGHFYFVEFYKLFYVCLHLCLFKLYAGARKTGAQIPCMWNTVLINLANKVDSDSKGSFAFEVG